jgi:NADPH-dependent 2,4-dienoyl-CoA reductase/sulfur reductase-like enzyme
MTHDVVVIGAGPAGLAAASAGARCGLDVAVIDEDAQPGGQVYRGIEAASPALRTILGEDYARGAALVSQFPRWGTRYLPRSTVWSVARRDDVFDIAATDAQLRARAIVVATGAIERPFPVPGWTLPGVMTAGAAQSLLKSSGIVARDGVILAGNGPLLWLVAWQYVRAGAPPLALLDTTPRGRLAKVMRHAPAFVASAYFRKGLALVREVRRRTRVVEYVDALELEGDEALRAVRFRSPVGSERLPAAHAFLHQGVVPDVNLPSALGCALAWDEVAACFRPVVDAWGGTSQPGVYVAGDGAGIAGAEAAELRGALAGLAVANALGRLRGSERDNAARPIMQALAQAMRGRRFIDELYRPADALRMPQGDTLACRCEEVAASDVVRAAREGCAGPNDVKAHTRCGMGLCQGRYCGLTVAEIVARERGVSPAQAGALHARFPLKPVTLADVAALPASEEAMAAVNRS